MEHLERKVRQKGQCVSSPTQNAWFPAPARGAESLEYQRRQAANACAGCPVRTSCLTVALEYEIDEGASWGIWGGVCPRDRRQAIHGATQRPHCRPDATYLAHRLLEALSQSPCTELDPLTELGIWSLRREVHSNGHIA
ncbi:WhiB family transcriptional regulator [Saccharopolyspora hattusasensis]|uniref:WhiB family transcriptional regulator n=1 Tax=Saccharopolyspora hattusasensis TaxID=1128679 RepID=UPI003D95BBFC